MNKHSEHTVFLKPETDSSEAIKFDYQSESFDEYETNHHVGELQEGDDETYPQFTISKEEIHFSNNPSYPARMYSGFEFVEYVIKLPDRYVLFGRDYPLDEQEMEDLVGILKSIQQ